MISRDIPSMTGWVALTFIALFSLSAHWSYARADEQHWPCTFNAPILNSTIPEDVSLSNQSSFNCFAWQEFFGLNWPAAPGQRGVPDLNATAADFGAPNAKAPTVWQTYKNKEEVFLAGATKPLPWHEPPPKPKCLSANAAVKELLDKHDVPVLRALSAFGDFILDETKQASGQWLADQAGNLVYYEIKLNKDEFDSIVANGFYNADVQWQTAKTGTNPTPGGQHQVKLPVGAIELKSAWRVMTNPSQYDRYLTTQAILVDSAGYCSIKTMGLVGLHIIHKTASQPQFVWATFEHVDNVLPTASATFYNPGCKCQTVIREACGNSQKPTYQNCISDQYEGDVCSNNVAPSYFPPNRSCPAYPVQVTRNRSISDNTSDPVVATNTAARATIIKANKNSVFQYYELIDVLWSTNPQSSYNNQPNTPGPIAPLSISAATPDPAAYPVANTTMETYVQNLTCLTCHIHATVPNRTHPSDTETYASDYSFILGDAKSPVIMAEGAARRRHLPAGLVKLNQ